MITPSARPGARAGRIAAPDPDRRRLRERNRPGISGGSIRRESGPWKDPASTQQKSGIGIRQAALLRDRSPQWRVDYVNAENSMGFHAPQEAARILAEAIDYARLGQMELRTLVDASRLSAAAK